MKNLFFAIFCVLAFSLTSCGDDDDCKKCSVSLLGIESTIDVCQDGDDLTVTSSALGVSETETVTGVSLSDYVSTIEASGYSCN